MRKKGIGKYLGTCENTEYYKGISETGERILFVLQLAPFIKSIFGIFRREINLLERQTPLLVPTFLNLYLDVMGTIMKEYVDGLDKEQLEKNRDIVMTIDMDEFRKDVLEQFEKSVENIRNKGEIVPMDFVNKFYNGTEFDSHPLDKTLEGCGFTKVYSDRDYRIKKEYSVRFGLEYSIGIAYVKYTEKDGEKIILDYATMAVPYDVLLKFCEEE